VKTRFGQFVLDSDARQLLREGNEVHLSPKGFDLLCTLVARRPNAVPKADLFRQIWPNTFVVEANLTVLVGEIRRAIADEAQSPRFIRTVHGVGYAFSGAAEELESVGSAEQSGKARFWLVWRDRTFVLLPGDNVIGRDPHCGVWLDHSGVSRRHARIWIASGSNGALLDDLGSTNGTFVGGQRVQAQPPLGDGDIIRVGSVALTFRAWSDKPSPTKRIRVRAR
jgi:DNA-binding winged helix-turn-helix (wHTH) protein